MARSRRLLFVSVPMHGHLNPLLEPAKLLIKQGHCVQLVCYEHLRDTVESAGIPFTSLGTDPVGPKQTVQVDHIATKKAQLLASAAKFTGWEEDMYPGLLRICRSFKPDALVADLATLAAHDLAEAEGIPLALLGSMPLSLALDMCGYSLYNRSNKIPFEAPGMAFPEHMSLFERHVLNPLAKRFLGDSSLLYMPMLKARDLLRERFGLPGLPLCAGPMQPSRRIPRIITIIATSWLMEAKRDLPRNWHLVGAMGCDFTKNFPPPLEEAPIKHFLDQAQADGVPAVLVATGTTVDLPESTVREMAQAFKALPGIRFVWSLKEASQGHLPAGYRPSNVLISSWVPQTAVLGHRAVKGFLCHGGHTTSNEGLAVGKPMLCMPFGGDQPVVAQHVKDHHYGLQVDPAHLTAEVLAESMQQLLGSSELSEAAAAAGAKVRKCCGPALTAWLLADFARDPPVETDDDVITA